MMNEQLFTTLLNHLQLKTLAAIIVDLEEAQEAWQYYAGDAPPDTVRQDLMNIRELVAQLGTARAKTEQLDFPELLEQVREAQQDDDWLAERNRQNRENWYKDYE